MEDIGKLLKHPLVIVVAVFLAALAFYYIASPYQNCYRDTVEEQLNFKYTKAEAEQTATRWCIKHSW